MTRSHWTITTLLGLSLAGTLVSAGCGKAAPEAKPKPEPEILGSRNSRRPDFCL